MNKQLLCLFVTIFSLNCYSQISFEKGYYIDKTNQKIECLIKNIDWNNNPTKITYKLSDNGEPRVIRSKSIKEFGIYNDVKYISATVNIDRSSDDLDDLSTNKNPIFNKESLFFKVLVEGKSNLYVYTDGNLRRYFYSKENSEIEQLIFKRYKTIVNKIGENNRFRQQLWTDLKCSNLKLKKIQGLDYKKNNLVPFFVAYNECHNSLINIQSKPKKDLFNLTVRPRLNSSSLTMEYLFSDLRDTDFGNKTGFGIGLEAEFIIPFNKNKWAVTIEPTYQRFKSAKTKKISSSLANILTTEVDYKSIELPISLRHYFFLNKKSKLFIDVSYIFDLNLKSSINFVRDVKYSLGTLKIASRNNLGFGLGYKLYDKYSLEMRYQTSRKVLDSNFWDSDFKTVSIIFGYSLF